MLNAGNTLLYHNQLMNQMEFEFDKQSEQHDTDLYLFVKFSKSIQDKYNTHYKAV